MKQAAVQALKVWATLVPVVAMFTVAACTLWYNQTSHYTAFYDLVSNLLGIGFLWIPQAWYFALLFHLCQYSIVALAGLACCSMINITYWLCNWLGRPIYGDTYMVLFENTVVVICASALLISIIINLARKYGGQ
jgi:hypothetical protein